MKISFRKYLKVCTILAVFLPIIYTVFSDSEVKSEENLFSDQLDIDEDSGVIYGRKLNQDGQHQKSNQIRKKFLPERLNFDSKNDNPFANDEIDVRPSDIIRRKKPWTEDGRPRNVRSGDYETGAKESELINGSQPIRRMVIGVDYVKIGNNTRTIKKKRHRNTGVVNYGFLHQYSEVATKQRREKERNHFWLERMHNLEKEHEQFRNKNNFNLKELKKSEAKMFRSSQEKGQKVILYARYRSGGTFASIFLSKHHDFYSIYEPLKLINAPPVKESPIEQIEWIEKGLDCNLTSLWNKGLENSFLGSDSLLNLKTRIFCGKYEGDIGRCKAMPIEMIEQRCKHYKHIVIKVIQVETLESLAPLLRKGHHIIYIVRDPRSVISSILAIQNKAPNITLNNLIQEKYYSAVILYVFEYCDKIRSDLQFLKQNRDIFQKFSFSIMRYEDFAHEPYESMVKLYGYLKVNPDHEVKEWARKQDDIAHCRVVSRHNETLQEGSFNTKRRNCSKGSLRWKRHFPIEVFRDIEHVCGDVLMALHYSYILSEDELIDQSHTFIKPFMYDRLSRVRLRMHRQEKPMLTKGYFKLLDRYRAGFRME